MTLVDCSFAAHGDAILDIFNDAIANTTALYECHPRTLGVVEQWFAEKQTGGYPICGAIGYKMRESFGKYRLDPLSVSMEKRLST